MSQRFIHPPVALKSLLPNLSVKLSNFNFSIGPFIGAFLSRTLTTHCFKIFSTSSSLPHLFLLRLLLPFSTHAVSISRRYFRSLFKNDCEICKLGTTSRCVHLGSESYFFNNSCFSDKVESFLVFIVKGHFKRFISSFDGC